MSQWTDRIKAEREAAAKKEAEALKAVTGGLPVKLQPVQPMEQVAARHCQAAVNESQSMVCTIIANGDQRALTIGRPDGAQTPLPEVVRFLLDMCMRLLPQQPQPQQTGPLIARPGPSGVQ